MRELRIVFAREEGLYNRVCASVAAGAFEDMKTYMNVVVKEWLCCDICVMEYADF